MIKGVHMNKVVYVMVLGSLALLASCGTKPEEQPAPPPAQTTTDTSAVDNANATTDETATQGPSGELLSKRIIYFDYDSAEIRADSQSVVAAHSRYLATAPATTITSACAASCSSSECAALARLLS